MQPYRGGGRFIELSYIKWKFLWYLEREVDACEFSFLFKGVRIIFLMSCALEANIYLLKVGKGGCDLKRS